MKQGWSDAHCHLADSAISSELDAILGRSRKVGIDTWVQGGVDRADWARQLELKSRLGDSFVTVFGLHPWRAVELDPTSIDVELDALSQLRTQMVALGETGLDMMPKFASGPALEKQRYAFHRQLVMAKDLGLPLVLHVVRAHGEVLAALKSYGPFPKGGIVHAFSGDSEIARSYRDLNFIVSLGPQLMRPGYKALKAMIPTLPLESFVLETDSPDQAKEPAVVVDVAAAMAVIRGETAEKLLATARENLSRVLGI